MTAQIAAPEGAAAARHRTVPRTWRNPWLLAWLAFLPVAVIRAGTIAEGDTFWEIRAGLLAIAYRAIPRVDSFTWTMRGRPWTLNSWGFDVGVAAAYRVGGLPGVAWACAGLVMAVAGLVLLLARQLGASPLVAGWLLLLGSPLLAAWLSTRPQLADYLAVLTLVLLLRRLADGRDRIRGVLAVGALSAVWVNLHAAVLLGVVMTATCAVLQLGRGATRDGGWWCLAAGAAALAGACLNPYGLGVFTQAAQVQSASAGLVAEWQGFDPASPVQWVMLATGLAALALSARRRDAVLAGALAVAAAGSVVAIRFLPFLMLLALPVLAARLSSVAHPAVLRYARSRRVMFRWCGAGGLAACAVVAALSGAHSGRPDPALYPAAVVSDIPAHCRLFTSDSLGDFVILERPDVPVSFDSRYDLYGHRRVLADARALQGRGNLAAELKGAGCVLVPPAYGLAGELHREPGWELRASDPAAVLFVRR